MSVDKYFSRPDFSVPRRLIAMVVGPEGSGKTHFALTASELGPTAYIDTDRNVEGVMNKFMDRDIVQVEIQSGSALAADPDVNDLGYKAEWEKFKGAYYAALDDPKIKVGIVDNFTEIWELCRANHFGTRMTTGRTVTFAAPNGDMRRLIRDAKAKPNMNLILIHKLTNEYANDKATGNKVAAGFKEVPYLVQIVINCWRRDGKFGITIGKCTHKPSMEGLELVQPMATFPILLGLVHD